MINHQMRGNSHFSIGNFFGFLFGSLLGAPIKRSAVASQHLKMIEPAPAPVANAYLEYSTSTFGFEQRGTGVDLSSERDVNYCVAVETDLKAAALSVGQGLSGGSLDQRMDARMRLDVVKNSASNVLQTLNEATSGYEEIETVDRLAASDQMRRNVDFMRKRNERSLALFWDLHNM